MTSPKPVDEGRCNFAEKYSSSILHRFRGVKDTENTRDLLSGQVVLTTGLLRNGTSRRARILGRHVDGGAAVSFGV